MSKSQILLQQLDCCIVANSHKWKQITKQWLHTLLAAAIAGEGKRFKLENVANMLLSVSGQLDEQHVTQTCNMRHTNDISTNLQTDVLTLLRQTENLSVASAMTHEIV